VCLSLSRQSFLFLSVTSNRLVLRIHGEIFCSVHSVRANFPCFHCTRLSSVSHAAVTFPANKPSLLTGANAHSTRPSISDFTGLEIPQQHQGHMRTPVHMRTRAEMVDEKARVSMICFEYT